MKKILSKYLVILVLGFNFSDALAGTWTWKNETQKDIMVTADFLACIPKVNCVEPFSLAPGASKTISKGAYMLSSTRAKFQYGSPDVSNSFSNIPGSFSDVTFTITLQNDQLTMTKTSTGGVSVSDIKKKAESAFTTAKNKVTTAFLAAKQKIESLLSQLKAKIKAWKEKLMALIKKKKTLESKLEQQIQQGDKVGQAKTQKEIDAVTSDIRLIEKVVVDTQKKIDESVNTAFASAEATTKTLQNTASTSTEKMEAQKEVEKLRSVKQSEKNKIDAQTAKLKAEMKTLATQAQEALKQRAQKRIAAPTA